MASTADVYASEQLRFRDWFATVEHPEAGTVEHPGAPFRLERPSWKARPAPLLGEHQPLLQQPRTRSLPRAGGQTGGPLEGLRILDLTMGWAGPLCTLQLADLGAEVIKIEGPNRMDWWRSGSVSQPNPDMSDLEERRWEQSPVFNGVNRNKRELVLDLKSERGLELFAELVAVSDVVVESFSPRVLRSWGLGWERLQELNERLILLSLPAVGQVGPWSHYVGYASTTEALSGLPALCGYEGEGPILQTPSIADPLAGLNGAAALALALLERERSGRGQRIEVAHVECLVPLIGEALMDWALNRRVRERHAAGDVSFAPNGVYPCAGDDRWVVVSAADDGDWDRLCRVIGRRDLAVLDAAERVARRVEVDEAIAAWTSERPPRAAMQALQEAGVVAAAVNSEADLLDDPQVAATAGFVTIDGPYVGPHPYPNVTVKLSATPGRVWRAAPQFGEDNEHVLREVLGLSADETAELQAAGVIADVPSAAARARLSAFGGQLQRHAQTSAP